jgi:NTE family protein
VQQAEVSNEFTQYVNKPIDTKKIQNTIEDLQGTGIYSSISYNMIEKDGETGLLVRPRLKNYGPPFLDMGVFLSSNDANDIQLGLGGRATFFGLAGPRSEVRLGASIGQVAGVNGELYKPFFGKAFFGKGPFVAPRGYYEHTVAAFYSGSSQLAQYTEAKNGFGVDLGYLFNSKAELRFGEDYQWYSETLRIGTPIEQAFSITPWVSNVRFQYLGQDSVQVPTRGTEILTKYIYSTQSPIGSGGYSQWDSIVEHFIPIRKRGILFGTGSGGTSFGDTNLGLAGFSLGGPLRLSAYNRGELLGSDYFLAQAGYLHQLFKLNPVIGDSVYVGGLYEIGKVWNPAEGTPNLPNDVAGIVIMKTLIGPIFGGASIVDSDHRKWFFGIGRIF